MHQMESLILASRNISLVVVVVVSGGGVCQFCIILVACFGCCCWLAQWTVIGHIIQLELPFDGVFPQRAQHGRVGKLFKSWVRLGFFSCRRHQLCHRYLLGRRKDAMTLSNIFTICSSPRLWFSKTMMSQIEEDIYIWIDSNVSQTNVKRPPPPTMKSVQCFISSVWNIY